MPSACIMYLIAAAAGQHSAMVADNDDTIRAAQSVCGDKEEVLDVALGHAEMLDALQYPSTVELHSCDNGTHTWKRRKACCTG